METTTANTLKSTSERIFTQEMIPSIVFNHLIHNIECDASDVNDVIGFRSEHEEWILNFHCENEEGFRFQLSEFGFFNNNAKEANRKFIDCKPNSEQLSKMKEILSVKVDQLLKEDEESKRIEAEKLADAHDDRENGLYMFGY